MRLIIGGALLLLLVLFALSNTQPVRLGLWPVEVLVELPLAIAMLTGMATAFLVGGVMVWLGARRQRRQLRDAEHLVRLLQAQLAEQRPGAPSRPPE